MGFTTPHDEQGPISTRNPRPSCAIMMNTNGGSRPADEDEAVPLLTPDHSEPPRCPNNSTKRPVWFQHLLCVYHVARRTAPQLISIDVLWIFAPLGLISGALHWNSILTSIVNFLAIIPLSAAVSDTSDKLSDALGDLLGALINATFGNAVELIVILHFPLPRVFLRLIIIYIGRYPGRRPWRYKIRPVCHARKHFIGYSFR